MPFEIREGSGSIFKNEDKKVKTLLIIQEQLKLMELYIH